MNNKLGKLLRRFVRFVNALFHKNKYKVLFTSLPDYSDNARALYEYMIKQDKYSEYRFVWLVGYDFIIPRVTRTIFIRSKERRGIWYLRYLYHLFTSYYLFCTHSSFDEANPKQQLSVCLWHGTMLKRICAMNEREKDLPAKDQFRHFVAPSQYYINIFCDTFLCQRNQVILSGYPRCDYLFQTTDVLGKLHISLKESQKLIVYMPTFRQPIGGEYSDTSATSVSCIDFFDDESINRLSSVLKQFNVKLVIKWHPADTRQTIMIYNNSIITLDNNQMQLVDAQIYHLLHFADALITDYSSVFCDYMILNRPMAFDIRDIDSYADNRGFVFSRPIDYLPGSIIRTENDLFSFIRDVAEGNDQMKQKRNALLKIYNDHCDDNNCIRLLHLLGL